MKTFYLILFMLTFNINYSQSEKTLEETKAFIVKMINENGWEEDSSKRRLRADFEGDLLRINSMNKDFSESLNTGTVYNFATIYKLKGPIKKPGDIGRIIIWTDYISIDGIGKWKKGAFDFDVHNYDVGEQLMKAFRHLNELLIAKKPPVEKF